MLLLDRNAQPELPDGDGRLVDYKAQYLFLFGTQQQQSLFVPQKFHDKILFSLQRSRFVFSLHSSHIVKVSIIIYHCKRQLCFVDKCVGL